MVFSNDMREHSYAAYGVLLPAMPALPLCGLCKAHVRPEVLRSGGQSVAASSQWYADLSLRTFLFTVNVQVFFMLNAAAGVNLHTTIALVTFLGKLRDAVLNVGFC